jgi:hypothetical protein
MSSAHKYLDHYLNQLRQGKFEEGFFGLIEAEEDAIPLLIEAFGEEKNREIRAQIVHCVWQHRRPMVVAFLGALLLDPEEAVWREALDGLVAIGGPEAVRVLEEAKVRVPARQAGRSITIDWIDEALVQLPSR